MTFDPSEFRYIEHNGETNSLSGWSRKLRIPVSTLYQRLEVMSVDEAFTRVVRQKRRMITYEGKTMSLSEWALHLGMSPGTLGNRLARMEVDKALGTSIRYCRKCTADESSVVDDKTPWASDVAARAAVVENDDGMTLEDVGDLAGVSRERIRQIEACALRKVKIGLEIIDRSRTRAESEELLAMVSGRPLYEYYRALKIIKRRVGDEEAA